MKYLYIVRHAKSSWDFPHLSDHDRPLNKRGKRNAPEMGERLLSKSIIPDLMISSTAKRAYKTAFKIAEKLSYKEDNIILTKRLYHADVSDIVEVLSIDQNEQLESIMIFGHNPGLTYFSNWVSGESIDNVPTAGVVAVELPIVSWRDLREGSGKLIFFDYPKKGG
ncbi:MAG: histidine phosphatase family protein [Bacteroidota bacterium]